MRNWFPAFFTCSVMFFAFHAAAQYVGVMHVPRPLRISVKSSELGIFSGSSYYLGDLNPAGHFNRFTQSAAGILYRVNINPRISAKAVGSIGQVEANDSYSRNEAHVNRNLSFKSMIVEFAVEGEFNFLPYVTGNKKYSITTPYVFAGVALFNFNPQGFYQNTWYDLQPLGTEGQGSAFFNQKPYSLTQFAIPFGVGLKVNTAKKVSINFEWGLRKTFTDYLDDVSGKYVDPNLLSSEKGPIASALSDKSFTKEGGSNVGRQRGNASTKDWYVFTGVILSFRINGKEAQCELPH